MNLLLPTPVPLAPPPLSSRAKRSAVEGSRCRTDRAATGSLHFGRDDERFRRELLHWYREHGRDLPWRRTRDPYAILVSEFMLQQTQVATVIPFYHAWLRRFPNVRALAAAPESEVLHAWQGLGYYTRARNLHAAAKTIGLHVFPTDIASIRALPGVGRYTANAVATFALDRSVPVVEANIARVLSRLLNLHTPTDSAAGLRQLWAAAESLLPASGAREHNSALMDLGAMICVPRKPKCGLCPVRKFCRVVEPATLPRKRPRASIITLTESYAFVRRRDTVLLEQSSARWRGMWTLPPHPPQPNETTRAHTSQFPFTNHRITLEVFLAPAPRLTQPSQRWFPIGDLHAIPMPSPHRRALHALLTSTKTLRPFPGKLTSHRMTPDLEPASPSSRNSSPQIHVATR